MAYCAVHKQVRLNIIFLLPTFLMSFDNGMVKAVPSSDVISSISIIVYFTCSAFPGAISLYREMTFTFLKGIYFIFFTSQIIDLNH